MANQIAETIKSQLSHQTLYMLGAYDIFACENGLVFKIKGSKKFRHIKIILKNDLYDMTFTNWRGDKITNTVEITGLYVDMLHKTIEEHTGLYTKL